MLLPEELPPRPALPPSPAAGLACRLPARGRADAPRRAQDQQEQAPHVLAASAALALVAAWGPVEPPRGAGQAPGALRGRPGLAACGRPAGFAGTGPPPGLAAWHAGGPTRPRRSSWIGREAQQAASGGDPAGGARRSGPPLQLGQPVLHRQAIFLMTFLHLLGFTLGGPVLPALKAHFGVATAETGLITSAFPTGLFLASFVFPALSDRMGRKPVLVMSYLGVGTGFVLQAIAISSGAPFGAFLALRAGSGAFAGASTVVKAYIADVTKKEDLPSAMAAREAAATLAYLLGPLLGGLIFTASSLTCVVLCCGLASFASAAAVLVCLRAPAGAEGQPPRGPRPREEGEALRALLLSSERNHPNDYVSEVLSSSASGSTLGETKGTPQKVEGPQPEARTSWSVVAPAMVIHFLYVFARACVDCFFVVFCAERFGLQPAALGRLMTAQAFLMFLNSTVLYKRIVRATDVLSTAAAGMAIVCLSLLGLGRAESVSALVWTMVLYAMGAPLFNPSITILLVRLVPRRRRGRVLGLDQAGCSVFRILSPALMGLLFRDSLPATFVASGAVMFVAALLATLLRSSVPAARG